MNNILNNPNVFCYGCESCYEHCPKKAISLCENEEGFIYPVVDSKKCVECGLCLNFCPIGQHEHIQQPKHNLDVFALSLNNQEKLKKSSSGGAAYALMTAAIEHDYTVFGVAYDNDFKGCHYEPVSEIEGLAKLRGTKYIQAKKGDLYKKVKKCVEEGRKVLFIGLPCEVAALKLSLRNDLSLIVFVELACHGVTSPKVSEQYVSNLEKKNGDLIYLSVREKIYGWTPPCLKIIYSNGKESSELFDSTAYGYAFRNMSRMSCYTCEYKGNQRAADITIADYWGVEPKDACWNDYGVSAVFVHSTQGRHFLDLVCDTNIFPITSEQALKRNSYINKPRGLGKRENYAAFFVNHGIFIARNKVETLKEKTIRILRNCYYILKKHK